MQKWNFQMFQSLILLFPLPLCAGTRAKAHRASSAQPAPLKCGVRRSSMRQHSEPFFASLTWKYACVFIAWVALMFTSTASDSFEGQGLRFQNFVLRVPSSSVLWADNRNISSWYAHLNSIHFLIFWSMHFMMEKRGGRHNAVYKMRKRHATAWNNHWHKLCDRMCHIFPHLVLSF